MGGDGQSRDPRSQVAHRKAGQPVDELRIVELAGDDCCTHDAVDGIGENEGGEIEIDPWEGATTSFARCFSMDTKWWG